MSRSVRGPVDNRNAGLLGPSAYRWSDEEKRRLGTVLGRINGHPARGSTSCSPGIGKAGLPDWLHISAAYEEVTMARGSKVFRPADLSESNASSYPEPFREGQRKRYTRRLGDHAGLKNYGVNLVRVLPDGQSSARHTHSKQDEFVYVVEGEFVLVTDAGRETVGPGTCIGFPAGTGDGHHFLNPTQKDAIFLVIGDRTAGDEVTYPDIDLARLQDHECSRRFCGRSMSLQTRFSSLKVGE